jgi:penicillin-binding protein 1A
LYPDTIMTKFPLIRTFWILLASFFIGIAIWTYAVSLNAFGLFGGIPSTENLANPKSELASEVYTEDGVLLGKYFKENRSPAEFSELSPNLIKALFATEDIRFEDHSGIDMKGTLAILWYVIRFDRRGSSTLTQQLAKNLFDTRSELYKGTLSDVPGLGTVIIKTKEWITAVKLERTYTKQEILTMYLNVVHFGSNTFGIKTASRTFFNTTPDKLTLEQSAMLVGVLKAPTLYSPVYNPEKALKRRNTVIEQMKKYDFLTEAEAESLKLRPIDIRQYKVENHNEGFGTYFRTELKKDLQKFCHEKGLDLYSDGLKIYTTINSRMQRYAEQALDSHMKAQQAVFFNYWRGKNPWVDENGTEIKDFILNAARKTSLFQAYKEQYGGNEDSAILAFKRPLRTTLFSWKGGIDTTLSPWDSIAYTKHFLHSGMMSMDPFTGHIKAWVGGINYKFFKYDHVRQGRRQPGSSFKPIVYAAAMDNGFTPCTEMVDAPVTFYNEETNTYWTPKNSDGKFTGERMTLRKAMAQSINSVAAQVMKKLGPERVVEYARRLGITSPLDAVPALCLGASDVSVFELVSAYSTFVSGGTWTRPYYITRIADKNGNVLATFNPEKKEVISEETAYMMVHMLMGATKERNGTALGLHRLGKTLVGNEVGGKTGTTSNYSDGWFMGITKQLVTGIWVGGEDRSIHFRSFHLGQGSKMAMPIWSYYMDKVYADPVLGITKGPFKKPANLSVDLTCSGRVPLDTTGGDTNRIQQMVDPSLNSIDD